MADVKKLCPKEFLLISGDDALTLPLLAIGGVGIISVAANIVPKDVAQMVESFQKGDLKKAQELHYKMLPLVQALFCETSPTPVKTAMELMGLCSGEVRLPLCEMSEANLAKLKTALSNYGLIK
jgi:4-hydroxy-tetrahydrodipicolinate synthase